MDNNLTHVCERCGDTKEVFMKTHYLGVHFVEKCKCGTRLCTDPYEIHWPRYTQKDRNKVK